MGDKGRKKYQHEPLVIFLDDASCDDDTAKALREAGFTVEQMSDHFPSSSGRAGKREQGVKDPRIISLCARKHWLIVTKDKSIPIDHIAEIKSNPELPGFLPGRGTHAVSLTRGFNRLLNFA